MKVEYRCCAGLDLHRRMAVACVLKGELGKTPVRNQELWHTTAEVMEMLEWLKEQGTHVAMEATGNYGMPICNLLEGHFELIVANATHMKGVPGRKTDVQDAEGIAALLRPWAAPWQLHCLARAARLARAHPPSQQLGGQTRSAGGKWLHPEAPIVFPTELTGCSPG